MQYNYYIDKDGNYVERPADSNPWKSGYTRYGFRAVKRYKNKAKRRNYLWYKIKRRIKSLFA